MEKPCDLTDDELLDEFNRTDGESERAEQLLAEIRQRGLDL